MKAKRILVGLAASVILSSGLSAQDSTARADRDYKGLWAGAAVASTWVGIGDGETSGRWGGRFDFGYRARQVCINWMPLLCWQRVSWLKPLRLTGGLTLFATDVRGMDPERDDYAFSNVDFTARASYPSVGEKRLYVEARRGTRTAELLAPNRTETWNYSGSGVTLGWGIEIPITPSGRGLEIGVTYGKGRFTKYEFLELEYPADLAYRATVVHVGWSGPFSGASLPWQ
jgi:hypothetical protein